MTVVNDGGEIVALDGAGYGAVTVTKSVTITSNPGFYAGIAVPTGDGVTIATASVNVTLRGLNINGTGGASGVVMTNGNRLSIENCVISNLAIYGVYVNTPAEVRVVDSLIRDNSDGVFLTGGARAVISGSKILGSSDRGILVVSSGSTTTTARVNDTVVAGPYVGIDVQGYIATATAGVSIDRAMVADNSYGIISQGGTGPTVVTLGNSMVTGNVAVGLYQSGTATLESLGNNNLRQNAPNLGTITTVSPM